ncbi:ribonuclease H [Nocardia sp. NPDC050710]|uniref:ribonuclease H family protein n=1 Tax=Nocardia sp. NPDC050710 TaxID=3157220 RepID=UPI0033C13288
MIIVSTDGSCLRNPGGAIGWAWVNHQGSSRSGGAATGTNQIAELRAVHEAIVAHPGPEPLLIESDSLYAIKCASEWISGWRINGWRTSSGAAVKNVEIIKQIDRAIASRPGPVRFRWVRGHVGNYFNEQADALAGAAARQAAVSSAVAEAETVELAVVAAEETLAATQDKTTGPRASGKAVAPSAPQTLTLF